MKKVLTLFALACLAAILLATCGGGDGGGGGAPNGIALLDNTDFVDFRPGFASAEASNLDNALTTQRHTVTTFSRVTASAIRSAVSGKAVLAIPELESGDLNAAMDDAGRDAIADFVRGGGTLLVFNPRNYVTSLLNDTFGFALVGSMFPTGTISRNAADTAGTTFANCGPPTLGNNDDTMGMTAASLPAGAKRIYTDPAGNSVVTLIPVEKGNIVVFGWDWYDATPVGTVDLGWYAILYRSARLKDRFPDVGLVYSVPNVSYADDVKAKLEGTCQFDNVILVNAGSSTPTLAELEQVDAVLVFSDTEFDNNVVLGNNLADYMNRGGGVVLAVFSSYGEMNSPAGRFLANDYYVIPYGSSQSDFTQETGVFLEPSHPILAGVKSFDGGPGSYQPATDNVVAGSTRIADWSDGTTPLVAVRTIGSQRRADLGFYPPSSDADTDFWDAATDGDKIMANALTWTAKVK